MIKQVITCTIRRCSCHSMVEARSIAEEFTSLLEKFLLLVVTHTFQSITLDVMGHRSAVVVVMLDRVVDSTAFMDLAAVICSRGRSHLPSCRHSSFSCSSTTITASATNVTVYNVADLLAVDSGWVLPLLGYLCLMLMLSIQKCLCTDHPCVLANDGLVLYSDSSVSRCHSSTRSPMPYTLQCRYHHFAKVLTHRGFH